MANNDDQEQIILLYDSVEDISKNEYLVVFSKMKVRLPKSISVLDTMRDTVEIPLWLAVDREIEMYEV